MNYFKIAVVAAAVVASSSALAFPFPQAQPETVNIYQQGVNNVASATQSGALGSTIGVNQWGAGNNATIVQSMHDSTISLLESGFANSANLSQTGSNSWASMTVKQTGGLNSATIGQSATGAVANVTQVGYHNTANVQQH